MPLRALLIDPKAKIVSEIAHSDGLDEMYAVLGCANVEAVMLSKTEALYVDEDGLLQDEPGPFFAMKGIHDPFGGRGMIIGVNAAGDHVDSEMMLAEVIRMVSFPDIRFVGFEPFSGSIMVAGKKVPTRGTRPIFRKRDEKKQH